MLDIFLYNEGLWFVNINFNIFDVASTSTSVGSFSSDFFWDSYLSENFYFDSLFFKKKKYYYSWTTVSSKRYFINYKKYTSLASHSNLLGNSYILWKTNKMFNLLTIDYQLRNFFFFHNFSDSLFTIFYKKKNVLWDFIFDRSMSLTLLDISKKTDWSYFTIFDFKKYHNLVDKELFDKKLTLLFFARCLNSFSLFLKEIKLDISFLLKILNFEWFGLYVVKDKVTLNFESSFILKNLIYCYLFLSKNFFLDNFYLNNYLLDFKFFEIFKFMVKLRQRNQHLCFFFNSDFFDYLYNLNDVRLHVFFNNILLKNYNYEHFFFDLSISNTHIYNNKSKFIAPVYTLDISRYGKFIHNVYIDKNVLNNFKLYFMVEEESIFYYLKYYLFYYDFDYDFDYFSYFYKHLIIKPFLIFTILKIKNFFFILKSLIFFIIFSLFFFFNLNLYINLKFNFIKSLSYLNWFFIWSLLYINFKFKNNKLYFIDSDLKFTQNFCTIKKFSFKFDLIIYIYIKFIIVFFGSFFKENYNLLRSESIYNNIFFLLNRKKSFFLLKNLLFLFIFYNFLLFFFLLFILYYFNFLLLLNLYSIYYTEYLKEYKGKFKFLLNVDGDISKIVDVTYLYTLKWYYNFFKYWINYYKVHYLYKFNLNFFILVDDEKKKMFRKFYSKLSDRSMFIVWAYSTIFLSILYKRDTLYNFRYFFVNRLYYDFSHYLKDFQTNIFVLNIFSLLRSFEFNFGSFFLNLNMFKYDSKIFLFDYSLLDLIKKNKNKYLSSNIYLNLEFETLILKPITKLFLYIFFNNIIILFIFFTKFLKYFKFELYLKNFFFYFFQIFYILFCFMNINNKKYIVNLNYFYNIYIYLHKIKYLIFIFFEIIFNYISLYIYNYIYIIKWFILFLFFFLFFLNLNILNILNIFFFSSFYIFFDYIYIYFFINEFFLFIFEVLFIQNILDHIIKFYSNFIIFDNFTNYFINYKIWVKNWFNLLMDYEITYESMSTRKAYARNNKWLIFNEYKDSIYAWIPDNYYHTVVRFIYVVILNKEPEMWFKGMQHYFQSFYRLGWDLLGQYVSKGSKFNIFEKYYRGFYRDSVFHSHYLGFNLNNLLYNYKFLNLINFFKSKIFFMFMYISLYIYFFFEFFYLKFILNAFYFIDIFIKKIFFFLSILNFLKINLIWIMYIIYYIIKYLYFTYFFDLCSNIYILFYNFFLINIFLNFFLFSYNFFFYYQETLYNFLNLDIDFIKQNIFNYKYKLTEDWVPLGTWPSYVYKFEQYTWIDNIFKEYFLRNLFYYEWKNLFFFKTFYTFYMNINRVTFFIFIIYLFFFYKICIYFLSFINKWFFFTFFNNDWSITRNPSFNWEKWNLLSKDNSYYFNEGIFHILGGNIIWNHFYFFNNNLDNYIFEQKNTFITNYNKYHFEKSSDYNNLLFFDNQLNITKNIWKNTLLKNNFFNWTITSLMFFKNYQFFWYKNLDFILIKYEDIYGNYSRSWLDKYNKKFFKPLDIDKYNYLILPNKSRVTYTHLFTKEWLFYKDIPKYKRFLFLNLKKYKYKNLLNIHPDKFTNIFYSFKNYNINELFYNRLQYPFLMFWITSKELNKNQNLKYLFPLLIQKKEIWSIYNDFFLQEKKSVENKSSVHMSSEWLYFFNTSPILPYLSILSRIDFNLTYNDNNYKGVWNSIDLYDRDLFLDYVGWDATLVKHPVFENVPFWNEWDKITEFENNYYLWLNKINKRYFSYLLPVFHRSQWLLYPKLYEQNLFKDLKYQSYDFDDDFDYINSSGMINYFKESRIENIEEPYTPEEWKNIFRDYTENAFFYGDDGIILMLLYRENVIDNVTSNINFISSFLFFFVPFYTFVVGSETYYQLGYGFVFQGALAQPVDTGILIALEQFMTMSDYDMQDERYFYINIIEQEFIDFFIRTYQEIFYTFTKYFNSFEYFNLVKKNTILLHDDLLLQRLYSRRMYKGSGRLFKSLQVDDEDFEDIFEELPSWFIMQERKPFYIFSDLSYNLPTFNVDTNNNWFYLLNNYIFLRNYLVDIPLLKLVFVEFFEFFDTIDLIQFNNKNLLKIKNFYFNEQFILDFFFFFLKNVDNNNYFFYDIHNYYDQFYFYYLNKNREYKFWFDKYFSWYNEYIRYYYYYNAKRSKFEFEPILPFFYSNSYIDILGHRLTVYKNFNKNHELYDYYSTFLKWNVYYDDYTSNTSTYRFWKYYRKSFKTTFIKTTRNYLMNKIDMEWYFKVRFLPITSFYLKFFDASHLHLNEYFIYHIWEVLEIYNEHSNIYVDKSTLLSDQYNLWQFQLYVNENRNYNFFPIFEFSLYLGLIFIFYLFFYIIFHCLNLEFVINKNYHTVMYYDKINDFWVDFKYYKKNNK